MGKKCIGCGAILQNLDKEKEGYITKNDSLYCERCFRIKNYGDYKNVVKDNQVFIDILKGIDKTDLVVLVMDLFNLPEHLDLIKDNITNEILIVLTKRDVLPKIIYEESDTIEAETDCSVYYLDTLVRGDGARHSWLAGMEQNIQLIKKAFGITE